MAAEASALVDGHRIDFPVRVESASLSGAYLQVSTDRVRTAMRAAAAGTALLEAGVAPVSILGRSPVVLLHVRYHDDPRNVLGAYHEFCVGFAVRAPDGRMAVHVHDLPVDQEFTEQAGRRLWGFPKWMADMEGSTGGARNHLGLAVAGEGVVEMTTRAPLPGLPVRGPATIRCVQTRDGEPVLVRATAEVSGLRSGVPLTGFRLRTRRPAGLHMVAEDGERVTSAEAAHLRATLSTLGVERARAVGTFAVRSFRAEFGEAVPLDSAG